MLRMLLGLVYRYYERQLEADVRRGAIPQHVGILPDGNRRFARTSSRVGKKAPFGAATERITAKRAYAASFRGRFWPPPGLSHPVRAPRDLLRAHYARDSAASILATRTRLYAAAPISIQKPLTCSPM